MERTRRQFEAIDIVLHLDREELRIAQQALNEICNTETHIPDWEFPTRMGVTRDEARHVLKKLTDAFDATKSNGH